MSSSTRQGRPKAALGLPRPWPSTSLGLLLACSLTHCCWAASWGKSDGYRFIDLGDEGERFGEGDSLTFSFLDGGYGKFYEINGSSITSNATIRSSALTPEESTLRRFSSETGGCVLVPVTPTVSNYTVRLGFAYQDYDGQGEYPSMLVKLQDVDVDIVSLQRWEVPQGGDPETAPTGGGAQSAHYTEYIVTVPSGTVELCLFPAVAPSDRNGSLAEPILNVLEIVPVPEGDGLATKLQQFQAQHSPQGLILSLKHRMNLGGPAVTDSINRTWQAESDTNDWYSYMRQNTSDTGLGHQNISTDAIIEVGEMITLPSQVLQTAWQGNGTEGEELALMVNYWALDAQSNPVVARLFFAELDPQALAGQRVFSAYLSLDGFSTATGLVGDIELIDVAANASAGGVPGAGDGTLTAFFVGILGCVESPDSASNYTTLWVNLVSANGSKYKPILNGLELWEVVRRGDYVVSFPDGTQSTVALCPLNVPAPPPWTSTSAEMVTPSSQPATPSSSALSAGAIVGIVLAVVTGLGLLVAVVVLLRNKGHQTHQAMEFQRFESEVRLSEVGH